MSEETNKQRIEKLKGQTGEKNPFYNRKHTPEVIQHLREKCANHGEANGILGKNHTEEYKRLKSEMMKGRYDGEKNPCYGKTHSEETRRIISKKNKGKLKGVPKSEEQKLKMRASPPNSKHISIDDVKYPSLMEAVRTLGKTKKTLRDRHKSDKYPTYYYLSI
ncbi:NUMOD3 domain-containing DNA-binding protein [Mesorhizobium sp. GbtcB19]|uniref:NUMOD3 domain-containing DNA-binding protein n=1 Tax=Mesorhizobium sp. GbtcB19 TaxID=2824764 RepID=UPI001C307C65|nr:NUMOD3 domain-containing DNA-binding protein [Mesorhizobium sp. GbtcB19]